MELVRGKTVFDAPTGALIVHQCNTTTGRRVKGLAAAIFKKYPQSIPDFTVAPITGTVAIHHCAPHDIAHLYGQRYPGPPRRSGDTAANRLVFFERGLDALEQIAAQWSVIVFPYNIGCGLARGEWAEYAQRIDQFATRVAPVRVCVHAPDL